jgi:two-component system chemotaxis response regulator CheB
VSPAREIIPQVRVLIADDSTVMRTALVRKLESSPIIRVCSTARNGAEAVEKTKLLQPDVVIMDVRMPVLDGIQALKQNMRESPRPVVMVSSFTLDGAQSRWKHSRLAHSTIWLKKISAAKPPRFNCANELIEKIEAAARSPLALGKQAFKSSFFAGLESDISNCHVVPKVLVLGTSTGGPKALQDILSERAAGRLAGRYLSRTTYAPGVYCCLALDGLCNLRVREARHGELFAPRTVYIAPAGQHMTVFNSRADQVQICLADFPLDTTHKPSVDVTMLSVAAVFSEYSLGIILTGMGSDGLEGMTALAVSLSGRTKPPAPYMVCRAPGQIGVYCKK